MVARIFYVEDGMVRLDGDTTWKTGQAVLVIPLAAVPKGEAAPPADLLAEDAAEFAPRRDAMQAANENELD
jgi:hypothetical protein